MKKLFALAGAAAFALALTACGELGGLFGEARETSGTLAEPADGEIIRSAEELDERVAYACENMLPAVKARLRDIRVWDELMAFYEEERDILVLRGINSLVINYKTYAGYIEAELVPEYEIYMKVTDAYKKRDSSPLSPEEKLVFDKAEEIIKNIPKSGTTFEKVFAIHEYLADNVEYDYSVNDDSFTVYGALIKGSAVCSGYAQSFKMLANMLDVDCIIVTGEAGGDKHAWNLADYYGEWYHIDATWDDQSSTKTRKYLNVSDDIMKRDHVWNGSNYPAARGMKYNYYRYTGKNVSAPAALEDAFDSAYSNGERFFEIVCSYDFKIDDLAFLSKYGGSVSYAIAEYGDGTLLTVVTD
ncbi:MAG: hypothetical protein LBI38_02770 [Oscillospiraceae bacterium]|jgi:hypothetical protein|nr:hypothetical protein [Oscillospiraceae bacterium]